MKPENKLSIAKFVVLFTTLILILSFISMMINDFNTLGVDLDPKMIVFFLILIGMYLSLILINMKVIKND